MSECAIIGIGNLLMGDDGLGIHAVRYLRERLPESVDLLEGGVYGLDLLSCLEGRGKVVFIDAIDAGDEPGAVYRFSIDDIKRGNEAPAVSMHDFGILELVAVARLLDQCPADIKVIAVQVKTMETGMELSGEVKASLPHIHRLVLEEIDEIDE